MEREGKEEEEETPRAVVGHHISDGVVLDLV